MCSFVSSAKKSHNWNTALKRHMKIFYPETLAETVRETKTESEESDTKLRHFLFKKKLALMLKMRHTMNKTIKDGDIAPWTIWKDLNKKKGKGKNKGKEQNKEIEQDYISKWRGSSSVSLFFVSLRAFGAQVVRMLYVLLFFFTILNSQTIFIYFNPFSSIFINLYPRSTTFIHFYPLSSTFTHLHPLVSTFIHLHLISSTFIHFHPFYPLSSTFIHFHPLSSAFIQFHTL